VDQDKDDIRKSLKMDFADFDDGFEDVDFMDNSDGDFEMDDSFDEDS